MSLLSSLKHSEVLNVMNYANNDRAAADENLMQNNGIMKAPGELVMAQYLSLQTGERAY